MADAQVLPASTPLAVPGDDSKAPKRNSQRGMNLAPQPARSDGDGSSPETIVASPIKKGEAKPKTKDPVEEEKKKKDEEFQLKFELPDTEKLIEDYSCAHTGGGLYQGRLFLSKNYICFHSPVPSKIIKIRIKQVTEIAKKAILGFLQNALEIADDEGHRYSFTSFIYRDQCYSTLMRLLAEQRASSDSSDAADSTQPQPSRALDRDVPSVTAGSPPAVETLAAALAALPPPPSADDEQPTGPPLSSLASLALTTSDCEFILNTRKSGKSMSLKKKRSTSGVDGIDLLQLPAATETFSDPESHAKKTNGNQAVLTEVPLPADLLTPVPPLVPLGTLQPSTDSKEITKSPSQLFRQSGEPAIDALESMKLSSTSASASAATAAALSSSSAATTGAPTTNELKTSTAGTMPPPTKPVRPVSLSTSTGAAVASSASSTPAVAAVASVAASTPNRSSTGATALAQKPKALSDTTQQSATPSKPLQQSKHLPTSSSAPVFPLAAPPTSTAAPTTPAPLSTPVKTAAASALVAATPVMTPAPGAAASVVPATPASTPAARPLSQILPIAEKCSHFVIPEFKPIITQTFPFTIEEFYDRFWADGSDEVWRNSLKSSEFTLSKWGTTAEKCCMSRKIEFRVPYTTIGVASTTRVNQTQHLRLRTAKEVHLETESVSLDVPYGDSFVVHTMWRLTPDPTGCMLQLCTTLRWVKTVWMIKAMIEKPAMEGSSSFLQTWVQTAVKMAEEPFLVEADAEAELLFESHQHLAPPATPLAPSSARVLQSPELPTNGVVDPSPRVRSRAPSSTAADRIVSPLEPIRRAPSISVAAPAVAMHSAAAHSTGSRSSLFSQLCLAMAVLLLALLWSRVSTLEQQLSGARVRTDELEARVSFLQGFAALLSANITGSSGGEGMVAELARWQATRGAAFTQQLGSLQAHLQALSRSIEQLGQDQSEAERLFARLAKERAVRADPARIVVAMEPHAQVEDSGLASALMWLLALLGLLLTLDHVLNAGRVRGKITALLGKLTGR